MVTKDVLMGAGIGAALAFVADPRGGRRRRALARDKVVGIGYKARTTLDATTRDIANRTSGIVAAARGRWEDEHVDDRRLLERVRATFGRVCSHPHAIAADAMNGNVTLRGPILAREVDDVLAATGSVRGVVSVTNTLAAHESSDGVPGLRGQGSIAASMFDVMQRKWAPATQAFVTAAGLAATAVCVAAYIRR